MELVKKAKANLCLLVWVIDVYTIGKCTIFIFTSLSVCNRSHLPLRILTFVLSKTLNPSYSTLVLTEVCQDCNKKTDFVEARLVVRDRSIFCGSKEKEGTERARSGKLVGVEAEEPS